MDSFVEEVLRDGLANKVDELVDVIARKDKAYQEKDELAEKLEEKYLKLNLSEEDRQSVDDFVDCRSWLSDKLNDFYYVAGVQATVKVLRGLDLLKGPQD